ncbi:glucose-6-phosphate isomerase, partial [Candidatus Saccharibacteria bacterium]|nr:glucose-6-phosphate isomerase [Candidatus Saccharibacteria bacterium]
MVKFTTDKAKQIDLEPINQAVAEIKQDDMSGWLEIPTPETNLGEINSAAKRINETSDYLVCIGIGGSYLGHRAVIDALDGTYKKTRTKILYSGNSMSSYALKQVLEEIGDKDFSVNVISKSGTTTEPAVAFRIFKQALIDKYGEKEAYSRIYATTDGNKGALHDESVANGYTMFVVPDNVGGRYSVLTPVGLLPIAVAGIDIDTLIKGAKEQTKDTEGIYAYASLRSELAKNGYDVEILATFEPRLAYFNEWWKQLFGESEGKNNQGIWPSSTVYTTDLHSLGQYIQQGRRNIIETVVKIATTPEHEKVEVPKFGEDQDGLGYLEGKSLDYIASKALEATVDAHRSGGIPVFELEIEGLSAETLGNLIFFFEYACAISAKL